MTRLNARPPGPAPEPALSSRDYTLHPLAALDGVLIYAALNGETVGYFFGPTAEAAAEALTAELLQHVAAGSEEKS